MTDRSGDPARASAQQFRIGFLVHDVSRLRRTLFDQVLKPLGITRAQWWALANLSRFDANGVTQTDLSRVMDMGKVTVGGLIDRLEASGHVTRQPHPGDRRVKCVLITRQGHQILKDMRAVAGELNIHILKDIDPDAVRRAEEVLRRMKLNLRGALDVGTKKPEPQAPPGDE